MKISSEIWYICFWLLLAMFLLTQVAPGEVILPYADY